MKKPKCQNCDFFSRYKCRRYPPQIYVMDYSKFTDWPDVIATDWCGEFKKVINYEKQ